MSRPTRIRATAFAKVTLTLRVLGRRPDGYHELDAVAVSMGQPHDTIEASVAAEPGVRVRFDGDDLGVPDGDDNLAVRAADRLLARVGRQALGVDLLLRKRIPVGSGLGGGSADAAAALLAVRHLLELPVDDDGIRDVAASLGSDVPFCALGGAARIQGRGEVLTPVDLPLGIPFLVATAPFALATADVYATWDAMGEPRSSREVPPPRRLAGRVATLVNDLEPAAEQLEPRLVEFRDDVERAAGVPALLAGSGSSYVVPVEAPTGELPNVAARVSARLGRSVVPAATVSRGVRVEP